MVVSDVDGCLLDAERHSCRGALPALRALARGGVSLVLASSKTRAEMVHFARGLALEPPMIVENGGAILLPAGEGRWETVAERGSRAEATRVLGEVAREVGARVTPFSTLTSGGLGRIANLTLEAAERALAREYGEAFLLEEPGLEEPLAAAAARRGLRLCRGARFHHLTAAIDKGGAFQALITHLARRGRFYTTVGLGDAANDLSLLQAVDRPIVMPRGCGGIDPALAGLGGAAELAPRPGPRGWNAAVLTVLSGGSLACCPPHAAAGAATA
jgi:mannosyl-3-phosphoglycerate phosphatase